MTKICRHIKTNGCRCRSPRLKSHELCYFHARLFARERVLLQPEAPSYRSGNPLLPTQVTEIDLPTLEDAESIQVSISLLVLALARNRIDSKRAAVLLYGLQLASSNAKSIITEPFAPTVVRAIVESPHGTDFDADTEDDPRPSPPTAEEDTCQQGHEGNEDDAAHLQHEDNDDSEDNEDNDDYEDNEAPSIP